MPWSGCCVEGLRPTGKPWPACRRRSATLEFVGRPPHQHGTLRALRPRRRRRTAAGAICKLDVAMTLNTQLESADRRAMSCADSARPCCATSRLLNACGIDDVVDQAHPECRSVINFGLRSQADETSARWIRDVATPRSIASSSRV
jgi:hypothetical protein